VLVIRLLGPFQVTISEKLADGFSSDKVRALLAYLASNPHIPIRREFLSAMFWPESPNSAARANLRSALTNLRRVLGDSQQQKKILETNSQTISLEPTDQVFIDVVRFTDLVGIESDTRSSPQSLEEAVDLYTGPFLEGLSIKGSTNYDDWLLLQRENLHRLVIYALQLLTKHNFKLGEYEKAVAHASRQVELDPWVEEGHRDLMTALAYIGQRNAAIVHYQRYRESLFEELGVKPSSKTIACYEQLASSDVWPPAKSQKSNHLQIKNPYKGLRPFQESDADDFFGREALIEEFIALLDAEEQPSRFIAIVGSSGSGKSSLVRAGIIPALRSGRIKGSENWFIATMTPGNTPFEALETALLRIAVNPPESLIGLLKEDERGLHRALRRSLPDDESTMLIVIDQFEELFLHSSHYSDQALFMQGIYVAVSDPMSQLRVIITLRADYFDRPLMHPALGELFHHNILTVLPMSIHELKRAIVNPARAVNVEFKSGLVELILEDIGAHNSALPYLQYALTETFDHREDKIIPFKAYQESGGVVGAISRRAESLYNCLELSKRQITRQVLLRLVGMDERIIDGYHAPLAKKRVARKDLMSIHRSRSLADEEGTSPPVEEVLDLLGEYRLLTFDYDPITQQPVVELAHEALIQGWERFQTWVSESWEDLQLHRRLSAATLEWSDSNFSDDYLLRGSRLELFRNWTEATSLELTERERALLAASIQDSDARRAAERAQIDKEKRLEQRSRRFLRILVVILMTAMIISLAFGSFAWYAQSRARSEADARSAQQAIAEQQARISTARELAMAAQRNIDRDAELSILLAIKAVEETRNTDGFILPEAENALHQAVQSQRVELILENPDRMMYMVDFAPNDQLILAAGYRAVPWDHSVRIWDLESGEQTQHLKGMLQADQWLDQDSLVTFDFLEEVIQFWSIPTRKIKTSFPVPDFGENLTGTTGNISPDFQRIAVAFSDGVTRVWDIETAEVLHSIPSESGNPHTKVAFSPDGTLLVLGRQEGMIDLVELSSRGIGKTLMGHSHGIYDLAFTSDGNKLISVSGDSTAKIWDTSSGTLLSTLTGHSNELFAVALDPEETKIATTGWDRKIIMWDFDAAIRSGIGIPLITLSGHTDQIHSLAFSSDGMQLVSGSWDGTARIWNVSEYGGGEGFVYANDVSPGPAQAVAISLDPTGRLLGFANSDPDPKLWDTNTGEIKYILPGDQSPVEELEFSPADEIVATLDLNGNLTLWDTMSGERLGKWGDYKCGEYEVISCDLAFNSDGKRLALGDSTGMVYIFNVLRSGNGDPITLELVTKHRAHQDAIFELAFSPDDKVIASASWDTAAESWEIGSPSESTIRFDHPLPVYGVTFSPDGSKLATSSQDGNVRLWNPANGELLLTMTGHTSSVYKSAFSPDGKRLASASYDGTVKVWDVDNGQELLTLEGHTSGVSDVLFSQDGKRLISASVDGTARTYLLHIDELMSLARERVNRQMTESECRQYLHHQACLEP